MLIASRSSQLFTTNEKVASIILATYFDNLEKQFAVTSMDLASMNFGQICPQMELRLIFLH
jgi:hypothetical protein